MPTSYFKESFNARFKSLAKRGARLLCGAAVALSAVASHAAPELGVYQWDAPTGPANLDSFSQWLGRPVTLAAPFEARGSWDDVDGAAWQLGPWSQWVSAQSGRNVSLAVPMLPLSGGSLASCAAGQYDGSWRNLANELAYYRLNWAYLRLGWEMDGTWFNWNAAPGSGREGSYAGCFRRIVQVMRQAQPANQWKFVLNPTVGWYSKSYLDAIWPGDAYVDVVALDLYDQSWKANTYPYPASCDANCRLTRQQNAWNDYSWHLYTIRDFALAHGKKVALPEWGVAIRPDGHGGGDNPYFMQKMHEFIHNPANNVAYHVYWNVSAADIDGRLTNSVRGDSPSGATRFPQAASVFKQLFGAAPPPANTAPTVSFTAPSAGQTVSGSISYAANATDNAGVTRVEFSVGSTVLASDTSAPYGGSLDTRTLPNGTHTLRAVAFDAAGLSASSQVSINVQNGSTGPGPDPQPQRLNVALASAGAVASASSTAAGGYPVSSINDNQRTGATWGNGGGWSDDTGNAFPDWVQVNFSGSKSIDRMVVYTLPDNYYANPGEPTDTTTFSSYGVVNFTVQGWNGSAWVTLATVTGNNLVKRTVTFPAFTTDRVRVHVTNALNGRSRITEVEAWGVAGASLPPVTNVALASAGAAVSASSTALGGYPVSSINDNQRTGATWGNGGGWSDDTGNAFPDWVQVNFSGAKSIERMVVYTLPDNYYANPGEPTDTTTFSSYGVVNFTVQGWNGSGWVNLASVTGNNLVKRTVTFPAFTTDRVRVHVTNALNGRSRITEVEAWGR